MSVESQAASITVASTDHTHAANFQIMKVFIEAVKTLSLDSSYQQASAILDENASLSQQISTKNEELAALNETIKNVEMARDTTYGEMFEANQKEKNKCAEASKEIGSLKATIQEKEKVAADQKQMYDDISQQLENLRASYKKEHDKILQANQDIDGLQQNLKSKDSRIEDLRVAGSKIKQAYARLETQVKELEGKNASLEKTLRNDSARRHELEGYAAPYCEEEGNALLC
jgi:chromosome segregation ATPase